MATELTDVNTLEAGHQGVRQVSRSQLKILYELKRCSIKMCCKNKQELFWGHHYKMAYTQNSRHCSTLRK